MGIFNADGSQAGACGNATRCVGALLMRQHNSERAVVHTVAGALHVQWWEDVVPSSSGCGSVEHSPGLAQERAGWVEVDMNLPRFGWEEVPLQAAAPRVSTADLGLCHGPLRGGVAVSVGNPHVVFFLDTEVSLADVDLEAPARQVQALSLFPEGVNVSLAQCRDDGRFIDLRVYERGAGETGACGTGACATFAAARRLGKCPPAADICFASGRLHLRGRKTDGHLLMAGEAVEVFTGTLAPPLALLLEDR